MKVSEVISRCRKEPILLLQLAYSNTASAIARDKMTDIKALPVILKSMKKASMQVATLWIYAYNGLPRYTKPCVVMVVWYVLAANQQLVSDILDKEVTLKKIKPNYMSEEAEEYLHGRTSTVKCSSGEYNTMSRLVTYIESGMWEGLVDVCATQCSNLMKEITNLRKAIAKRDAKLEDWPTKYSLLEIENAQLRRDNRELSEYIAALQSIPEYEPESIPKEIVESRDLSGYKIKVCTTRPHMRLFEWECFDVDTYPKAVENCLGCDLVIIDTKHISHHTFWTVRDYCKSRGIKCVLASFINQERMRGLAWEALHK